MSNSPYSIKTFPPPTQSSTTLELETWLNNHLEMIKVNEIPKEIENKLDIEGSNVLENILEEFKHDLREIIEKYGIGQHETSSSFLKEHFSEDIENTENYSSIKIELTVKLFYRVLVELLKNEEKQQEFRSESKSQVSTILKNENFYRALLSCCLETILFVHNTTALDYEEVLDLCKVSAFDSWKLMKNFIEFDPKIPTPLRIYFKSLESRVISYLGWVDTSPILGLIKQYFHVCEEDMHPAIMMFCRKVLSHAALRILDLSNLLGISDQ